MKLSLSLVLVAATLQGLNTFTIENKSGPAPSYPKKSYIIKASSSIPAPVVSNPVTIPAPTPQSPATTTTEQRLGGAIYYPGVANSHWAVQSGGYRTPGSIYPTQRFTSPFASYSSGSNFGNFNSRPYNFGSTYGSSYGTNYRPLSTNYNYVGNRPWASNTMGTYGSSQYRPYAQSFAYSPYSPIYSASNTMYPWRPLYGSVSYVSNGRLPAPTTGPVPATPSPSPPPAPVPPAPVPPAPVPPAPVPPAPVPPTGPSPTPPTGPSPTPPTGPSPTPPTGPSPTPPTAPVPPTGPSPTPPTAPVPPTGPSPTPPTGPSPTPPTGPSPTAPVPPTGPPPTPPTGPNPTAPAPAPGSG